MDRSTLAVVGVLTLLITAPILGAAVSGGAPQTGTVAYGVGGGPTILLAGSTNSDMSDFASSNQISLETDAGSATFSSSADTQATITTGHLDGLWANLTAIDATGADLTVNQGDVPQFTVGGDLDTVSVPDSIAADDGQVDFEYSGSSGTTTITLNHAPADTELGAYDTATGSLLGVATSDASGQVTFSSLPNSQHSVQLVTTQGGPALANPQPDPATLQNKGATLAIDVDDPDFNTSADSVGVTIEHRPPGGSYSQVHSETLTSAGTASTSLSNLVGGTHDVRFTATDAYGQTETTTHQFKVPNTLTVYNETQPDQKLSNIDVELQFFGDDGSITERSTGNDGTIDMTGLPVEQTFVVTVEGTDDFTDRRVFIRSIYQQQQAYLLRSNLSTVGTNDIVFELDDRTGDFAPGETGAILQIERPMTKDFDGDGNDETEYEVISGDRFDATDAYPATLENQTRYRLRLSNNAGDERVLGSYTVTGDAFETLTVGQISFGEGDGEDDQVTAGGQLEELQGSRFVRVFFDDRERQTSNLDVRIYEYGNASNEIFNQSFTSTYGEFGTTVQVPASAPDDVSYKVEIVATRDGKTQTEEAIVGAVPDIADRLPISQTVIEWFALVSVVAVMGLVVVFDDSLAAIAGVLTAGTMGLIGALTISPVALGVGGTIAVLYAAVRRT